MTSIDAGGVGPRPNTGAGGDSRPVPDPTTLTENLVTRAMRSEREWAEGQLEVLKQRLDGIDDATSIRKDNLIVAFTQTKETFRYEREVVSEKFTSVAQQFKERDTRSERESRDNKVAVDAAFAAQKEAASEQNKSNALAISKSEAATEKTLVGLSGKLDDVKDEFSRRFSALELLVNGIIQGGVGSKDQRTEGRASSADTRAIIAFAISAVLAVLTIIGFAFAFSAKGN